MKNPALMLWLIDELCAAEDSQCGCVGLAQGCVLDLARMEYGAILDL